MIVDFHTHIFPEKIAGSTLKKLIEAAEKYNKKMIAHTDGTLAGIKKSMKECNVDYSVLLPVVTRPEQFETINRFASSLIGEEGICSFGGIHPNCENPKEKLEYIKSLGLKGIKIHPDYQNTYIDDERYIRIIKKAVELELYVVAHSGIDVGYPDTVHCPAERYEKMIEAVYSGRSVQKPYIILAHLGGYGQFEAVKSRICKMPVYLDLAYILGRVDDNLVAEIIKKHGADKILFATDSPWSSLKDDLNHFYSLPIGENEKKLILGENARLMLNLK